MTPDTANTIVAAAAVGALIAVAIAALVAAVALWRVARDVRRVTTSLDDVAGALRTELPQTLKELRQTAVNLNRVSDELGPRLMRVDVLLDESEATVQSLRATVETAEDIVRGPQAAMERARRAASAAGHGLARGADRLRRGVESRLTGVEANDENTSAPAAADAPAADPDQAETPRGV